LFTGQQKEAVVGIQGHKSFLESRANPVGGLKAEPTFALDAKKPTTLSKMIAEIYA